MYVTRNYPIRQLTEQERLAGHNVMEQCMGVKQEEVVLIVTDSQMYKSQAAVFYESAKLYSDNVTLIEIPVGTEHAQEPPPEAAEMMRAADVAFLVTTHSLSHTYARHRACQNGTRIASLPTITLDTIVRTLISDYSQVAALSKKVASILTDGYKARITSPRGTDFYMQIDGRSAIADTGIFTSLGDFGNLPAGEGFIAPVEGKSQGKIVFDGCFADITLDEPMTVTVKNGQATDIAGGQAAKVLSEKLERVGKYGRNIAEFGIGTNSNAKLSNSLLEVEKVYGTTHIALGNNITFGGTVEAQFHSDGVILKPTITIDESVIVKDGEFVI